MDRRLNLLMAIVGVVGANGLALAAVSAEVGSDLGRPAAEVMRAAALYGLGTAVAAAVLGPWIDRWGAGRMLFGAMAGLAAGLGATAAAPGFGVLAAAQGLAGLASGVALPAAYAAARAVASPGREAEALGRVLTGWTLAMVFGVTLAAVLAGVVGWRMTYGGLAVVALILAPAAGRLPSRTGGTVALPWAALRLPGVARGLAVQLAWMVAFYGTYSFLGAQVAELGHPVAASAAPVLAYGIGFALSGRFDPWLDRRGYAGAAPWIFGGACAVLLAIAVGSGSLWTLTAAFGAWGLANHLGLGLTVGRLTDAAGERAGAVLGLNTAITYVGVLIGAGAFAPLFAAAGLAGCALVCATLAAGVAVEGRLTAGDRSPAARA